MNLKDKFSDRLMIPIINHSGNVAGFTGRVLPYDTTDRPKYLNSSDSEWFRKGSMWFGWSLARDLIRQKGYAIIVEGNMDVIACHIYNLPNVLASQGTSVTEAQLKILKTITKRIWLGFDNDNAGFISGNKLFVSSQEFGFEVLKIIIPSQFKDLDEFLNSTYASSQSGEIILETMPYLDYLINFESNNLRHSNSTIQKEAIMSFLSILAHCDKISIDQYLNKLSTFTGVSYSTLESLVDEKIAEIEKQKKYQSKYNQSEKTDLAPSETKTTLINRTINVEEQVYLAVWQKICAIYYNGKLENEYRAKMFFLFNLLTKILFGLTEFNSIEEYINTNKDLIDLIISDTDFNQEVAYQRRLWNSLVQFVDRNHQMFILDVQSKEFFRQFKSK